ncbi:MAG: hypothetical protein IKM11_07465 [Oscillospiraceae bacterium]|nr:hypothetical protein [Oscillospiraceae bacterium]
MKQFVKNNAVLLLALLVCAAVSFGVIFTRMGVESKNKTYDIVLDYNELELLSEQSEHDIAWWLNEFKKMGITRVGLQEESLMSLMENSPMALTATMMDSIMQDADWRSQYPKQFVDGVEARGFDRFDVLVEVSGEDAAEFVRFAVTERFDEDSYYLYCENTAGGTKLFLLLDGTVNDTLYLSTFSYIDNKGKGFTQRKEIASSVLMYLSLGMMPEKVETIQSLGMEIIPRTICYNGHNDARYAQAVLDGYKRHGIDPEYIIAGGEAVIGFDDGNAIAMDYIAENGITIGLIENTTQRENIMQSGVRSIAEETDYNTVRVFSVWDYIQYRYAYYGYAGAEEIENTLFRAIVERNIRIIYFKPIKYTDSAFAYVTDIEVYRDMFESLNTRLAEHNISMGRASVMDNYQIPSISMLMLGLGAGLGGALLPSTFLPMKKKWTLLLAGAVVVCVTAAWIVVPNTFRLIASFANAVVFACLAAALMLACAKSVAGKLSSDAKLTQILPRACVILLLAVALSLVGAMLTAAPLSSTDYMLELGIFRGVKLAQLVPLAFFCVLFVSYYGIFEKNRERNTLRIGDIVSALQWTIPVWALILLGGLALVGYYYIARTGHETSVSISTFELILRNTLEENLLARPRTKEFLIAFPCVMLCVYSAVRRMPFFTAIFGLAGTIGMTSICNTFMHIRTPLYLGFVRTGYAVLLGIVIGVVLIIGFELLCRAWHFIRKKYIEAELN